MFDMLGPIRPPLFPPHRPGEEPPLDAETQKRHDEIRALYRIRIGQALPGDIAIEQAILDGLK